jgi:hypothetical protein
MNGFENRREIKRQREPTRISRSHPAAVDIADSLTAEQGANILAFFELLATWERDGQRNEYGNKSGSRHG